jgi:AraC family transcriptional regulator, regulatory protein of adaptative response / DNA-3-methyladenine glycosylase II
MMGRMTDHVVDPERCYRAAQSRDARFDGWFYMAVRTTGIYCRPSCPALTPKRTNVEFFRSAAAAQQRGFRACKRCRPDASPGSPEWDVRGDLVARAMRLIADGVVDREGVTGLSNRLGYSVRHLNRLLTDELGAGPLALARAQRAQTARVLVETTDLTFTDIAYAAGFGSVRQFNDTVREVYASPPGELRRRRADGAVVTEAGAVTVRLPVRRPFDGTELVGFLAARAIPGVEHVDGGRYARTLTLPHGHGTVALTPADDHVSATFRLADWRDLAPAVGRVRHLLDLDADPMSVVAALGADAHLGPLVAAAPGRRAAGSVDPQETLVRAIVGQQVSVAGARTVAGRITAVGGERLAVADPVLTHLFPSMASLADAPADVFPMPTSRADTIRRIARLVADGDVRLDPGMDRAAVVEQLVAVRGIGPWTARYVVMRGLGDPDVFLETDLGVRHSLDALGLTADAAAAWQPWRTYAMHHLWAMPPFVKETVR